MINARGKVAKQSRELSFDRAIREVVQRDEAMRSTQTGPVINRLKVYDRLITEGAKQWV